MPLVNAKCPNCGATLKTDDSKDAAICEFCNSAFIVERAINNFNTTINIANAQILVSDVDINNLIARAEQFKNAGDFNKASEYYNRVLDIDIKNPNALSGLDEIQKRAVIAGYPLSLDQTAVINQLLSNGKRIQAIKVLREYTGLGLKEAMDGIDAYDASRPKDLAKKSSGAVSKKNGCYIATAVYGSYECPPVWVLRRYRDDTLSHTIIGRVFIRIYYAISPTLVKWFGSSPWFTKLCKAKLDKLVIRLKRTGVSDSPYNDSVKS